MLKSNLNSFIKTIMKRSKAGNKKGGNSARLLDTMNLMKFAVLP